MFEKFKNGLKRTAESALGGMVGLFSRKLSEENVNFMEDSLLSSDFGVETTEEIMAEVRREYRRNSDMKGLDAAKIGASVLSKILSGAEGSLRESPDGNPSVICLVGVNGSGKTTTAAKLAEILKDDGGVVLGACDTFRAAANEQIREWAERIGVRLVGSLHGGDASAVAWDAWQAAKSSGSKWLILDTAGRLHTKENLMAELSKLRRVVSKNDPNAPHNSIIVIDGSLGLNSVEQARAFDKVFPISGAIVTKLDGTSRGGALAGIYKALKVPVLYVGFGEKAEDLRPFDSRAYADSVFGTR